MKYGGIELVTAVVFAVILQAGNIFPGCSGFFGMLLLFSIKYGMHGMFLGFFFELFFHHLRFATTTTGTIATITITAIDTIIDIVKNTVDGFCAFEFAISE